MDAIWGWTAENVDVLLFFATLLLAAVTVFLVFESRAARLSATLAATPHIWQGNEDVMAVDLANVGPAPATAIDVRIRWLGRAGDVVVDWARRLPALGPGSSVPYHPDTLLERNGGGRWGIARLAEEQLRLEMRWSWSDLRVSITPGRRRRHHSGLDIDMATYRLAVHDAPNVLYRSEAAEIIDGLERIAHQQRRYRELNDPKRPLPPDVRVQVEAIRLGAWADLWRARLRYWLRRRR